MSRRDRLAAALLPVFIACSSGADTSPDQDADADPAPSSRSAAVRFLNRASFGASPSDTDFVVARGSVAWIDAQVAEPPSLMLPRLIAMGCAPDHPGQTDSSCWPYSPDDHFEERMRLWWEHAVHGPDQLRQRVAFALSEIFVVSDRDAVLQEFPSTVADYYDTLVRGAFGSYRDLLEDVTLHPAMGTYLSMAKNRAEDPVLGTRPDENFAREVMQLFSIGLSQLDASGQSILDGLGQSIPTYDQTTITETARALTGWTYPAVFPPSNELVDFLDTYPRFGPMEPWPAFHDFGAKTIVGGAVLPANQSPQEDVDSVLDALAAHPNVGPFLGRQLIQRLVTSNPSPAYVERVAAVWNDDGGGRRGNLEAVVRAILLDEEARNGHVSQPLTFGKVREPVLRITALWRAFEATGAVTGIHFAADEELGQRPQSAPSVFNFFRPTYATNALVAQGLVAPEMQITTHSKITQSGNLMSFLIFVGNDVVDDPEYADPVLGVDAVREASSNVPAFVALLDERLCGGTLSTASREAIEGRLAQIPYSVPGFESGFLRAVEGIALVSHSADFAVQL
ncbi:MAG: DUF1800 domain-containing protein [Planctomycetota bacterium]